MYVPVHTSIYHIKPLQKREKLGHAYGKYTLNFAMLKHSIYVGKHFCQMNSTEVRETRVRWHVRCPDPQNARVLYFLFYLFLFLFFFF